MWRAIPVNLNRRFEGSDLDHGLSLPPRENGARNAPAGTGTPGESTNISLSVSLVILMLPVQMKISPSAFAARRPLCSP